MISAHSEETFVLGNEDHCGGRKTNPKTEEGSVIVDKRQHQCRHVKASLRASEFFDKFMMMEF